MMGESKVELVVVGEESVDSEAVDMLSRDSNGGAIGGWSSICLDDGDDNNDDDDRDGGARPSKLPKLLDMAGGTVDIVIRFVFCVLLGPTATGAIPVIVLVPPVESRQGPSLNVDFAVNPDIKDSEVQMLIYDLPGEYRFCDRECDYYYYVPRSVASSSAVFSEAVWWNMGEIERLLEIRASYLC
ncbi:hypothetical protein CIHG_05341 [Coccidioides immitis H538.4]|uniref:Uncharacterized protein n=1 Tax=Coccidioides immitis H538.4 TaxID=396776 RepID=A0A0J8RSJ9_COCIT|nr:hypothetical protein CIHG_05341 [Coccidioides immitis H538.4]